MDTSNELLTRVLELPPSERAAFAHHLLLSLERDDFDPDSQVAWAAEVESRLTAFDEGRTTASDWREAIGRIRQSLAQRASP